METVSRIGNRELSVTTFDRVAGKPSVIAEILSARPAIRAITIGPAKPRDSHAISDREIRNFVTDFFDFSDNLVTENQWELWIR
jgi:hypothetical protein